MEGLGGSLERAIMDVLWAEPEPLRVRELLTVLNENQQKPLAYNTVQTVAERLARKNMLEKIPDGQAFRYGPTCTREDYVAEVMIDALTGTTSDHGAVLTRFAEGVPPEDARRLLEVLRRRAVGEPGS
ncbi:BlaI/MecI/CopY family transcriptional regulator [Actinomadura sp. CNU-125]|uniref:BlaI/MecI/CopY family transcriptional regulator n=1 Tax=Actinomadura sp. CNU-125 TaxID=1904961 RepID=UPI00096A5E78|nr:BlaI/MecI/CopY family transcriptional regulator [Actinomadura sp. CNU-125]